MKLLLPFPYLANSFAISIALLYSTSAKGQIIPDNTTSTNVSTSNNVTEITGGLKANSNLFHSFREFSVANGSEAFFNNTSDINNIFSRVTGGNISNINGLIRANDVNLFLINPAGIIFGAGARLDIGGSFYGSTADSILFPDDIEFSATNADGKPILTINAPIGLSFRDNPESITVEGTGNSNLGGSPNITLIGGEISFDGGRIVSGTINLGGLAAAGTVSIDDDDSFVFPDNVTKADVFLKNGAFLGIFGSQGNSININADNLRLSETSNIIVGTGNDINLTADRDIS